MSQNAVLYDEDFYAWTVEQARLLRSGKLSAIDAANIAEEVESMGRSDRRELQSRLVVLTLHLLKWRFQPSARSRSWLATIEEQRLQTEQVFAGVAEPASARRQHAVTGLRNCSRARDRRDRPRRRYVPGDVPFCSRRSPLALIPAEAVRWPRRI
jgi:Domain of unknown function DUF29